MEGDRVKRRKVARLPQTKVDVHARWKPERQAEDKRRRRRRRVRRGRRRRREEDRAVDQEELE